MELALSPSVITMNTTPKFLVKPSTPFQSSIFFRVTLKFPNTTPKSKKKQSNTKGLLILSSSSSYSIISCASSSTSTVSTSTASIFTDPSTANGQHHHWMVIMESPSQGVSSKPEIIDYYVKTLEKVLGSEKDAQMCIYDASCDTHFGFCCVIDEEISRELSSLPGVLFVRPDPDLNSVKKDYSYSNVQYNPLSNSFSGSSSLFLEGTSKHWLVRIDRPAIGVMTKARMVDYYTKILTKVMGNEKDAQMCIYHISWQSNFGFCCELDEECARELAGAPGVLSVQPDVDFGSDNKDYGGDTSEHLSDSLGSSVDKPTNIKTKKLFIAGLSFYTSEKTLRAAFEGFGDLVEVKIIMDKISKRSKGFAFIEYTTEEAASAAHKEMNGKIINGWMIVVDVAKPTPPKNSRGRPRTG
ncbi:organelle RRM domain-containing protein 1, chloroplastic [Cornus florida]|uniref:organelle RRM domain-containing protein 1, chloroplastic n=1 Tax=Cornus florida TaxID=4283 RepID=UPI0028964F49|nr:organelle RRM domain-containing protein 1, chloroplastic [Cornus florida]